MPGPYDEGKMPFYALGVNLAKQMGGQANFKTLLEEDELEIMLNGFGDTKKGQTLQDPLEVLTQYGPGLNQILADRSSKIVDRIKKE